MKTPAAAALVTAGAVVLGGCGSGTARLQDADPSHGKQLIGYYGCGACHVIGGLASAQGHVGPPLPGVGSLTTIVGKLPNTPQNLVRWIRHPQQIVPGTDMPDLGIGPSAARDIAAYLYAQ